MLDYICLSYTNNLPNKLFGYIRAGLPVICLESLYVAELVNKYKLGISINREDLKKLNNSVLDIKIKKFYSENHNLPANRKSF